jgi:hypothetical protein
MVPNFLFFLAIPKASCIFLFELEFLNQKVELYGQHICFRSGERTTRKFKPKDTIEL